MSHNGNRHTTRIDKVRRTWRVISITNLHARGKPQTMVSARTACRDGDSHMNITSGCVCFI